MLATQPNDHLTIVTTNTTKKSNVMVITSMKDGVCSCLVL